MPFVQSFPNGEEIHRFNYKCIELYKMTTQEVLDSGLVALLPFLPLTRDGKEPNNIEQMVEQLVAANEIDLLAIADPLGGLVFESESEQQWFKRRFYMLQDILKDSWAYQELFGEGFEKGLEEGLGKGLEQGRQFALDLLRERNVAVTPGSAFGSVSSAYVRISLAASEEEIERGIRELCEFADR